MINQDAPVQERGNDRLGYDEIAEDLAKVIKSLPNDGGLVIGIEGPWGSGKTSLVNLVFEKLPEQKPVHFMPWLVGNRDELLEQLFAGIAEALPEDAEANKNKALREKIGKYAKVARGGAAVLSLMNSVTGKAAEEASKAMDNLAGASLHELREEIFNSLIKLGQKIIVFIDDLDRLEPREVLEVLRLIKAVANFPNITYLIAFDPDATALALETTGMADGKAFLEKIIQVSFKIPSPEPLDLTGWLAEGARKIAGNDLSDVQIARINRAAQLIGQFYLKTPRDVVRILNYFRLHYSPVVGKVDPGDMLFLQIARVCAPALFNWIEGYVETLASLNDGASLYSGEALEDGESLVSALGVKTYQREPFLYALAEFFPGLDVGNVYSALARQESDEDRPGPFEKLKVYQFTDRNWATDYIAQQRLASPDHHRLYFAFSRPAGALADEKRRGFLDALEKDRDRANRIFRELIGEERPQGGNMGEILLDRLAADLRWVDEKNAENMLSVMADEMDELVKTARKGGFGDFLIIAKTYPVFANLVQKIGGRGAGPEFLETLFREGQAVGWLADVLRREIFSHGFYGDQKKPERDWLLSEPQFEAARTGFIERLKKVSLDDLAGNLLFARILYAWQQGGAKDEVRSWVAKNTEKDAGLIRFLQSMKAWSSDGEYLNAQDLARFLNVEDAKKRLADMGGDEAAQVLRLLDKDPSATA